MTKRRYIDTLSKIRRWIGEQYGESLTIAQAIEALETEAMAPYKDSFSIIVMRDTVRQGSLANLNRLLELGYDPKRTCTQQVDGHALHVAARFNRHSQAMALIERGLSPTDRVCKGSPSALEDALTYGHLSLFEKLLKKAGDPNEAMREGFLRAAVTSRDPRRGADAQEVLAFVLDRFGPYPQQRLDEALVQAAKNGWNLVFLDLVKRGANAATRVPLTLGGEKGESTALGLLLFRSPPIRWDSLLNAFASSSEALFPNPSGEGKVWGLECIARDVSRRHTSASTFNLDASVAKAVALHTHQRMEGEFPSGKAGPKPKSPRL